MLHKAIMTTGLVIALAATAQAATLATGPLLIDDADASGDTLDCMIVNVGTKDVEVTVSAVLSTTVTQGPYVLPPQASLNTLNTNESAVPFAGHCVFEVKGKKKSVRASACALDGNNHCAAALPAF